MLSYVSKILKPIIDNIKEQQRNMTTAQKNKYFSSHNYHSLWYLESFFILADISSLIYGFRLLFLHNSILQIIFGIFLLLFVCALLNILIIACGYDLRKISNHASILGFTHYK